MDERRNQLSYIFQMPSSPAIDFALENVKKKYILTPKRKMLIQSSINNSYIDSI